MKYRNFRTVARILEIVAWLLGIIVFIGGLASGFIGGGGISVVVFIIAGIVGGFLSFAFLYAFSQFIYVLLDIERHTRRTVRLLLEEVEPEQVETEAGETEQGE